MVKDKVSRTKAKFELVRDGYNVKNEQVNNIAEGLLNKKIFTSCNVIFKGSDSNQRIGRKILIKHLSIKMEVATLPRLINQFTDNDYENVRFLVVLDHQAMNSTPQFNDIFLGSAPYVNSQFNDKAMKRYTILDDKILKLYRRRYTIPEFISFGFLWNTTGTVSEGTSESVLIRTDVWHMNDKIFYEFDKELDLLVNFEDNTFGTEVPVSNNIFFWVCSDSNLEHSWKANYQVVYEDNKYKKLDKKS